MTGLHKEPLRLPYAMGLVALALMGAGAGAGAQAQERLFDNPPPLGQQAPSSGQTHGTLLLESAAAPVLPQAHAGRERQLALKIQYTNSHIFDPASGLDVPVSLRSYVGTDVDPAAPFVAPTIDVTPGDTVRVSLDNSLPADPSCTAAGIPADQPHCFNGTNLHSHGLWVSPTGNSDNVLLSINPGVKFQYEYNIPADHPAGTFWYHPHRHGSTAIQVASGMAGALIIRGDRAPTPSTNGDLDTLLKGADGKALPERLLVLQQIPYACKDAQGQFRYKKDAKGNPVIDWTCNPGEVGVVESFDQLQPSSWPDSGRYTSVNGLVQPTFVAAQPGQVERWRLVHAGIRDTLRPMFRKLKDNAPPTRAQGVGAMAAASFIEQQCTGEPVHFQVVAADGLTLQQAQDREVITLQPGYRNDLLITFPETGRYCITDEPNSANGGVSQAASGRQLLGFVEVGAGPKVADTKARISEVLIASARSNLPADIQQTVIADLHKDLRLDKFIPHPSVADSELKGEQQLVFLIDTSDPDNTQFAVGTTAQNAKPYQPGVINRQLTLGDAETWKLQSAFASHPFHIHVNPFQIEKIIGPDGTVLSDPGAVDRTDKDKNGNVIPDDQYAGMKGMWKDTLFVKGKTDGSGVYTLYVRTRYQRYIGEFVLHCHILDHEDQGMMQNVSIGLPDGAGGVSQGAHH